MAREDNTHTDAQHHWFSNSKEYNLDYLYKNIFSYEIEAISNFITNKKKDPEFPAINRFETEVNMGILEKWINTNEN